MIAYHSNLWYYTQRPTGYSPTIMIKVVATPHVAWWMSMWQMLTWYVTCGRHGIVDVACGRRGVACAVVSTTLVQ